MVLLRLHSYSNAVCDVVCVCMYIKKLFKLTPACLLLLIFRSPREKLCYTETQGTQRTSCKANVLSIDDIL